MKGARLWASCGPSSGTYCVILSKADQRIRSAFETLNLAPDGPPGHIAGRVKRAMLKNRWAAEVVIDVAPAAQPGTTAATCRVDMTGTKHFAVLSDV